MRATVLRQRPPTHLPQSPHRSLLPPISALSAILQSSFYHTFRGHLSTGKTPLTGRMIGEIVRSQAPNKVLLAVPPQVDPVEQLLPRYYKSALSQIRSCYCHRSQSYHKFVGCADDPTCSDCHGAENTAAHLLSCPTHIKWIWPRGICSGPQEAQFLAGLPQFTDLPPTTDRLRLPP